MLLLPWAKFKIRQLLNEERTRAAAEERDSDATAQELKIPYGDTVIQKLLNKYELRNSQDLYVLIESEKISL